MTERATSFEAPPGMCPRHPETEAPYVCARCGSTACVHCCYTLDDGSICCAACLEPAPEPEPAPAVPPVLPPMPAPSGGKIRLKTSPPATAAHEAPASVAPPGAGCVQHPEVFPVAFCKICGKGSCEVCDFVFPGGLHYCPVCVVGGKKGLTPRRKKFLIASFVLAGFATVSLIASLVILGLMGEAEIKGGVGALADIALVGLVLIPSIVGTALSASCFQKGNTPWSVWAAMVWNFLLLGFYLLLALLGQFSS